MPHATVYTVEGVRELRAALTKLGAEASDFKTIHEKVAGYVGITAASRAPRQSGMLAASWRPGSAKANATVRFGGTRLPYANPVHWGTGARPGQRGPHNIAPNLFVTEAAADTEPTWAPWYLDELQRLTNKAMEAAS